MEQGHHFFAPSDYYSSTNTRHHQKQHLYAPYPSTPAMSHTASNLSPTLSPSSAEASSLAVTPGTNPSDTTNPALGGSNPQQHPSSSSSSSSQHQHNQQGINGYAQHPQHYAQQQQPHSQSLSAPQSAYSSEFSSSSSQQQQYQTGSQSHIIPTTQYAPHDQQSVLAPLQFSHLSVIGQQRSATGFPYEFDPSDSSCRNMYSTTDIDPTSAAAQQMPQQLTTNGYIRHSGGIPVGGTPHHQQQQQQPLDMTTASLPLPVDIGVDQNAQQQQQQQQPSSHMHMQSAIHTSNPQSSFGSSPVGNQPIFSTLSFQSSQMPEYDSYGRQPKPRSNRVIKPKRTPRPPNAFILYRKAKQAEVIRDNPGVSNKDVSCIIGQMWKAEDPLVQDKFREQAELEKKKHKEMHPNYKYQPRKPKNKRLQEAQGMGSVSGSNGSLVHGSTAAAVAAAVAASSPGQDGSFVNGSLQSALKDPSTPISGGGFTSSYSKYHMMMQPGQISQQSPHTPQQHQQPPQSQTPVPQHQQQQIQRGGEYYYRSDQQQQAQHVHANGFVGVPPQIDIKPGFVNGISTAAYWTPATPSDAAFSNTLPSGNVFHSNDQTAAAAAAAAAAANIRPFDSVVPQHDTNPAVSAGHVMGGGGASSAPMFHAFDHQQRQSQHHHQHDIHGHADYQNSQQQYHQQHHGGHNQQQQQGGSMLGSYVNSNQASYHHSQQGMDGLDGSSVAAADSQGLGLLSPPAVTWSTNM